MSDPPPPPQPRAEWIRWVGYCFLALAAVVVLAAVTALCYSPG